MLTFFLFLLAGLTTDSEGVIAKSNLQVVQMDTRENGLDFKLVLGLRNI
jgi:hypothetical protein